MIELLLWMFLMAMIVDGVKILVETFSRKESYVKTGRLHDITAIIAAHNEEDVILDTIRSVSRHVPEHRIVVVDDASTDGTVEKLYGAGFTGKIIELKKNAGKVGAYAAAIHGVKTKYTLLLDADILLGYQLEIPQSFISGKVTAVAFNVVPVQSKNQAAPLVMMMQRYEYLKSMVIGRQYHNQTKSVHCVSGAAGLFHTSRLQELSEKHSGIFPGEDLERTLIELEAGGYVAFSDSYVYTVAPETWYALAKQRIVGWWPGLWRNILFFFRLAVKRKEPFRLRWELVYTIFSLFTDPLKAISLVGLVLTGNWQILLMLYCIYVLFEIVIAFKLNWGNNRVVLLYPLYSTMQMFFRVASLFVFIWKRFLTREWAKVLLLMLLPALAQSQVTLGWQGGPVIDQPQDRMEFNHNLYLGVDNAYASLSTAPYKQVNVGMYHGPLYADLRYRWEVADWQAKVQYEYWIGDFVPRVALGYTIGNEDFMIGGLGASYYLDNITFNADAIHEWGRVYGTTYIGSIKFKDGEGGVWGTMGGSMTNFGNGGVFAQLGYGPMYLFGETTDRYDFNNFSRAAFGVGVTMRIN